MKQNRPGQARLHQSSLYLLTALFFVVVVDQPCMIGVVSPPLQLIMHALTRTSQAVDQKGILPR